MSVRTAATVLLVVLVGGAIFAMVWPLLVRDLGYVLNWWGGQ